MVLRESRVGVPLPSVVLAVRLPLHQPLRLVQLVGRHEPGELGMENRARDGSQNLHGQLLEQAAGVLITPFAAPLWFRGSGLARQRLFHFPE